MSPGAREIAAHHFSVRSTITPEQWAVIELERQASNMGAFTAQTFTRRLERLFELVADRTAPQQPA